MISSIVLTDTYKIGVNENGKFWLGETKSGTNEVPFVRYRFDNMDDKDKIFAYIEEMYKKFKDSVHLYELHVLNEETAEFAAELEERFENLAKFLYVGVTDEVIDNGEIDSDLVDIICDTLDGCNIDRIMLKDKSTKLDMVNANRIIDKLAEETDYEAGEIGICSSPLSFDNLCCLTAVKARELAAEYGNAETFPLPTANHQSMNCCGCIRYHVFNGDVAAPEGGKTVKKKEKTENNSDDFMNPPDGDVSGEKKEKKAPKKAKVAVNISMMNF